MSRVRTDSDAPFIAALRTDIKQRLADLEAEHARLVSALSALEGPRPRRPRRIALRDLTLAAIEADPGIRASMLAFSLGRDADKVLRVVEELKAEGLVQALGSGWIPIRAPDTI